MAAHVMRVFESVSVVLPDHIVCCVAGSYSLLCSIVIRRPLCSGIIRSDKCEQMMGFWKSADEREYRRKRVQTKESTDEREYR